MADRLCRLLWVAIVGCLIAGLAGCTSTAGGNGAGAAPAPSTTPAGGVPASPLRVLQLNLCNSGIAACYAGGRSIDEAAQAIRAESPDLVTLNEVCEDDVPVLARALAGGGVVSAFQAARDRDTGEAYRCRNGQRFGNGIVSRWPSVPGTAASGGIYPIQDPRDPEERAWVCLEVAATRAVAVCSTHLAYTDREVTVGQCRYLFGTVVAGMRARDGAAPLVLGGDLNLGSDDNRDLGSCLPAGSVFADDGDVQVVVATPEFVVGSSRLVDLRATDHPGLLVSLDPRGR
jgi:endonuclease/exonuclease/phosphatase family metal-dependent hydrolase